MSHRIAIALLGKGSTNHLHRPEVVDAFKAAGLEVHFLIRHDYIPLLDKLPGCSYSECVVDEPVGWRAKVLGLCGYLRSLYPASDKGRTARFRIAQYDRKTLPSKLFHRFCHLIARYRWPMNLLVSIEKKLFQSGRVHGLDAKAFDQLLLLGVGAVNSELESSLTWWAKVNKVPVAHIVGNYDNLSSKGFRGVEIDRLMVWGPNMRADAEKFHGIPADRITEIGSIRYNHLKPILKDKGEFLKSIGLDPARKTILFAGYIFEYHYFEMLEVFSQLQKAGENCQMILRVYPNKSFITSLYMKPLLHYARSFPGVYVSIGDPHYKTGDRAREVLHIEEHELWNSLSSCDLVINIFSTISLEACMFDKPAINMWYFQRPSKALARTPVYVDYSLNFHNRRIVSYGAIRTVQNRKDLMDAMQAALAHPEATAEQRKRTIEVECGALDGKACDRLVETCVKEFEMFRSATS